MAENVGAIEYQVTADTKGAIDSINRVADSIDGMVGEFDEADGRVTKFKKNIKSLGLEINKSGQVVDQYGKVNKDLTSTLKRLEVQATSLRNRTLSNLNNSFDQSTKASQKLSKSFKAMKGSTSQLSFQLQDIAVQTQQGTDAFIIMGQQGPQIASVFGPGGAVFGALIALSALIGGTLSSSVEQSEESLEDLIDRVEELGKKEKELLKIRINEEIEKLGGEMTHAWIRTKVLTSEIIDQTTRVKGLRNEVGFLSGALNGLVGDYEEEHLSDMTKELVEQEAKTEKLTNKIKDLRKTLAELDDSERNTSKLAKDAEDSFESLSKSLAKQIPLIGKNEREQAKLAASFELGAGRTKEQVSAINILIDKLFDIKDAYAKEKEAKDESERATKKYNSALLSLNNRMDQAIEKSKENAREAFILNETHKAGVSVDSERGKKIAEVAGKLFDETKAMRDAKKAQDDLNAARGASPILAAKDTHSQELENLRLLYDNGLIMHTDYTAQKKAIDLEYENAKQQIRERDFKNQSAANALVIDSLNALGGSAASAFSQFIVGATSAQELMRSLASTILTQAVGALVQLGIQQVKNQIIGQTAQAAAATTAAATGSAIAASYATAAAMASLASFGANAAPASAGIASTVSLAEGLASAGGLERGGDVMGVTEVGEGNKPEVLSVDDKSFLIGGNRGRVFNNQQLSQMPGNGSATVNIYNNAPGIDVSAKTDSNGNVNVVVDRAVREVEKRFNRSMKQKTGTYFNSIVGNTTANGKAV